ncbi:UDP-N-acetylmuramate--L-alanine ligase, partial [Candidatus Gottesmanbacteria bacterium]|nr:UDP-N-acetylmuramate--L-alanine ligase [Candidatus Gottesmanbacteria bacterium]
IAVGLHLGLSVSALQQGLLEFAGTKRRFEMIAQKKNVTLYDDYAHHPTEIQMTLLACRQWYPKEKIVVIFQPHTYSRTKMLLSSFARSFNFADEVLILPIFASAREKEDLTINSSILAAEISKFHPKVSYFADKEKLIAYLRKTLAPGTVIFTMGAGDVYELDKEIVAII